VTSLPGTTPAHPDDDGAADPALAAALAAADESPERCAAARTLLLRSRLLVPVVAVAVGRAADGEEKAAEMAVPGLVGADGRRALPAFTSYAALRAWRADARPVPMPGARVLAGAAQEGYAAVVVDVAGPVTHVVEGADLAGLARAALGLATGEAGDVVVVA
jgi:hypothetical protein